MPISHYKTKHLRKLTLKEEFILAQAFTVSGSTAFRKSRTCKQQSTLGENW